MPDHSPTKLKPVGASPRCASADPHVKMTVPNKAQIPCMELLNYRGAHGAKNTAETFDWDLDKATLPLRRAEEHSCPYLYRSRHSVAPSRRSKDHSGRT